MPSKHIVITTFGSLGDLHPYMAIALGLQARGHRVTIATSPLYGSKIMAEGIGFHPVRPDLSLDTAAKLVELIMDAKKGSEYVVRQVILPHLRDSYEDLAAAVGDADLLLTHPITFAGPLVAQKTGILWASSVLAPISFFSVHDPPALPPAPWLRKLRGLGPGFHRALFGLARRGARSWCEPVRQLRAEIGLPPGGDPLFEGQHSPELALALFSPLLGAPQPDWPRSACVTGFAFYDRLEKDMGLAPKLAEFLNGGPPPVVFTLGTSAVMNAGDFYAQSAEAAVKLGKRAVLLVGRDLTNRPPGALPAGVACFEYAPYSEIFSRAAAIVHQGGAGTTAQALRSGRPMLVVPFAHDQPDNAARVVRLGVAREVARTQYQAPRVAAELSRLLGDPGYTVSAAEVGGRIRSEDGVSAACEALERLLRP